MSRSNGDEVFLAGGVAAQAAAA